MKVTKDMTIGELLMADRGAGMILMQNGMHCVGCPSAAGETLEEASMVHGMDCDKLVTELNAYLEQNKRHKQGWCKGLHHPFCKERKIFKESNFLKESKENRRRRYEGTSGERQPQWARLYLYGIEGNRENTARRGRGNRNVLPWQ